MGGDPIPGPHVALREWFEAFKAGDPPEIEINPKEKVTELPSWNRGA